MALRMDDNRPECEWRLAKLGNPPDRPFGMSLEGLVGLLFFAALLACCLSVLFFLITEGPYIGD